MTDDPYSQPVRTLQGGEPLCRSVVVDDLDTADAALQVIASIADDLDEWAKGGRYRGFARRQAKRLREHVAKADAALGFNEEGTDNANVNGRRT